MKELFPEFSTRDPRPAELRSPNPCVRLYGFSKDRKKTCRECVHLYGVGKSRTYYKCSFRKFTHGPGSDHRVRWPACGKFSTERTRDGR